MIVLGKQPLSIAEFEQIVLHNEAISLDESALAKCISNHEFLKKFSENKIIYGINTGFGPMAQYRIDDSQRVDLQRNLIRSHCSGSGNLLPDPLVRGVLLSRLTTLLLGYSGVHGSVLTQLMNFINLGILPNIREHGSVGASGDLVQLAQVALVLIGEGRSSHEGKIEETKDLFEKHGLAPIEIVAREGLAIINGTAAMTGIGLVNIIRAKQLYRLAVMASCLINEIVSSFDDHFAQPLNDVKKHKGQRAVASMMRDLLKDSHCIRQRDSIYYNNIPDHSVFTDKVQEYYSLRCVPQILGPVLDTIDYAEQILIDESNSVNDNPIISEEHEYVFHGGNFHGDYVSLEMDKVKIAITRLSMLMERQLNFLLNDHLNQKLPPFINLGKLGFNFGLQGAQFTATSTTAENQTLSFPMYVHSISCNKDNQDIVSMGSNSALITRKVIDNSFEVIAIHLMAIVTSIEYLKIHNHLAPATQKFYKTIKEFIPPVIEDLPLSDKINNAARQLKDLNF